MSTFFDWSKIFGMDGIRTLTSPLKSQTCPLPVGPRDPCLYIHRFAHKLEFGEKEHDVAMTALRLVARMKRDWIHHGRRPSGLCGAALLVAARFHNFSRSVKEVVKVVRISNTTIRKRLGEFKDTPSSQLTIDEFQKIDLEEEQDPPCFTHARKKAKQQSEELNNPDVTNEVEKFQREIDNILGITKETSNNVSETVVIANKENDPSERREVQSFEAPENIRIGRRNVDYGNSLINTTQRPTTDQDYKEDEEGDGELDLTGLDDDELDSCLLTNDEIEIKTKVWMEENKEYLEKMKEKEEREAREREQGISKPEPKKKRKQKSKKAQPAATAGEAIEKMLVEKKISSKINYEVLRDLETSQSTKPDEPVNPVPTLLLDPPPFTSTPKQRRSPETEFLVPEVPARKPAQKREAQKSTVPSSDNSKKRKVSSIVDRPQGPGSNVHEERELIVESGPVEYAGPEQPTTASEEPGEEDDYFDDEEEEHHVSAAQLLGTMFNSGAEDEYPEYDDEY
ncbi:hypothetical protein QZH41_000748 [Actinostola sp. cb2023]|nr:hypothetical protein QZH41_000748 [Actinostola sp. cb2023]